MAETKTKTKTRTTKTNKTDLEETVARLTNRISQLVDDMYILKSDFDILKGNVAKDMTTLVREVRQGRD